MSQGTTRHPFRFAVSLPTDLSDMTAWTRSVRRIEDMGFHAGVVADHFTDGYTAEPMVALTAAAMVTSELRLMTGVLGNDYRHPVLLHRMAALLDVLSGGRFVLGLGAGWMTSDYEAGGMPLDPPGVRVDRLTETIAVVKGLFGPEPFSFTGDHYRIAALDGLPKPTSTHRPLLFLGGGSPRVLRLAGREADIVGINASLAAGHLGRDAMIDLTAKRVAEKVSWVRDAATAAGRHPDGITFEMNHWLLRITDTDAEADELLARMAGRFEVEPALLAESPGVLVGPLGRCIDTLEARREALGLSWLQLDAGFHPKDLATLAPLVAALAGR